MQENFNTDLDSLAYEYIRILDRTTLAEKISIYIPYSTNEATPDLSRICFERYKNMFIENTEKFMLHLAYRLSFNRYNWRFPYDNISSAIYTQPIEYAKTLLILYLKSIKIVPDLPFHRLSTSIFEGLLHDSEFIEMNPDAKQAFTRAAVKNHKDLCDIETIDYATLGTREDASSTSCIVFTTDSKDVILERLKIQNTVIQYIEKALEIKITTKKGIICILNQCSGVISQDHMINVDQYHDAYDIPERLSCFIFNQPASSNAFLNSIRIYILYLLRASYIYSKKRSIYDSNDNF